jgi:hypothetical protein
LLAFSSGELARLWDLTTGTKQWDWPLPCGLCDCLAFDAAGRLLSFRAETKDMSRCPDSSARFERYPRVCRLRELCPGREGQVLQELPDFNRRVIVAAAAPDGELFIAEGIQDDGQQTKASYCASTPNNKALWSVGPIELLPTSGGVALTPDGRYAALSLSASAPLHAIVDTANGKTIRVERGHQMALAPGANRWAASPSDSECALYRRGRTQALATIPCRGRQVGRAVFDRTGNLLVWGNADGTVSVLDIKCARERLRPFGLDWEE